jgi:hypothetical protein
MSRKYEQCEKLIDQRRRQRPLVEQLQEQNQELQETIEGSRQEIEVNLCIIEELLYEDPSEGELSEEYYEDSIEAESFDDIASVEIIEPPPPIRIPNIHPRYSVPRAVAAVSVTKEEQTRTVKAKGKQASPDRKVSASAKKKGDTPTPKKRTKQDKRKESFEKARARALDRKNAREAKEK